MHIPLLPGREFSESDTDQTRLVCHINETLAKRYWPAGDAIGAQLMLNDNDSGPREAEIVGIIHDVKDRGLETSSSFDITYQYGKRMKTRSLGFRTINTGCCVRATIRWLLPKPSTNRSVRLTQKKAFEIRDSLGVDSLKLLDRPDPPRGRDRACSILVKRSAGTSLRSLAYSLFRMETASLTLSYGMFLGTSEVHREIPGFSVSLLSPTLRAEDVPFHCHQNASFVLVLSGIYLSSADGAARISLPSTLFFNPAGTTHRDAFELAQGQFLAVSLSEQSCRMASEGTKLPTAATAFRTGEAVETAFRLARQCSRSESDSDSVGILEGLCWEVLSNIAGRNLWSEKAFPSWLRQAKELLRDQCSQPLLISGMAQQLGVHPVYLARTFRKAFDCTPGEYLARCRLHKAMALLRDSSLPLAEIALATGFFDQSHFSRTFRQHFGLAPRAYRKRLTSR